MSRMRTLSLLLGIQLALVGLYAGVEALRVDEAPLTVERLDEPAPPLQVERAGAAVSIPGDLYLVHFWATWCVPCQRELPDLLAAASAAGVPLLAVTNEPWPVVERYFNGAIPPAIVQDTSSTATVAWQVSRLPDTFVVRRGRLLARIGGPLDWNTNRSRHFLQGLGPGLGQRPKR